MGNLMKFFKDRETVESFHDIVTPMRVTLVGKTGSGKSSLGNVLLQRPNATAADGKRHVRGQGFVVSGACQSETKTCGYEESANAWGRHIKVVDTPGLYDTNDALQKTLIELTKVMSLSVPGPHAILFVIRLDAKFTNEEGDAFDKILLMFHKDEKEKDPKNDVKNFLFIVFSHGEHLEEDKTTIQDFIGQAPDRLKAILKIVGNKYAVISKPAKMDPGRRKREVENLLAKIDVNCQSEDNFYTNDVLQKMGKLLNEEIRIVAEKRNVSLQEAEHLVKTELVTEEKTLRMILLFPIVYASKAFAKLIGQSVPEKPDAEEVDSFMKRTLAKLEEKARQRARSMCVIS